MTKNNDNSSPTRYNKEYDQPMNCLLSNVKHKKNGKLQNTGDHYFLQLLLLLLLLLSVDFVTADVVIISFVSGIIIIITIIIMDNNTISPAIYRRGK